MKCPNCGKEFYNKDNPNDCPLCGYSFVENKAVENSRQDNVNQKQDAGDETSDKNNKVAGNKCENCGYVNNANDTCCKRCGRTVIPASQILKCPRCGNDFHGDSCFVCGYQTIQESTGNASSGFNNASQNMENSANSNQQNNNINRNANPENVKNQFNKQVETPKDSKGAGTIKIECIYCHYLNDDNVNYCQKCGKRLFKQLKKCPDCGKYLKDGTCSNCGYYQDESSFNRFFVMKMYQINNAHTILIIMVGILIVIILLIWFYVLSMGMPLGDFVGRGYY